MPEYGLGVSGLQAVPGVMCRPVHMISLTVLTAVIPVVIVIVLHSISTVEIK